MTRVELKRRRREGLGDVKPLPRRVVLDFSFDSVWVSISDGDFTNFLKNDDEYFKMHYIIFKKIIPIIKRTEFNNIGEFIRNIQYSGLPHSHIVDDANKINTIKLILEKSLMEFKQNSKEQAKESVNQNIGDEKLYQIGHQSVRIFGYFKENIFTILVIDYHHLIYSDTKHNKNDFKRYSMCPIKRGK